MRTGRVVLRVCISDGKIETLGLQEKSKIDAGKMFICSNHYSSEDIEFSGKY